jgi:hypothetical protein
MSIPVPKYQRTFRHMNKIVVQLIFAKPLPIERIFLSVGINRKNDGFLFLIPTLLGRGSRHHLPNKDEARQRSTGWWTHTMSPTIIWWTPFPSNLHFLGRFISTLHFPTAMLGYDAENKKFLATRTWISQDLSTSNAVAIKGSVTYPRRPNAGITLPHKRWWWSRHSRPQVRVDPDVTILVQQL